MIFKSSVTAINAFSVDSIVQKNNENTILFSKVLPKLEGRQLKLRNNETVQKGPPFELALKSRYIFLDPLKRLAMANLNHIQLSIVFCMTV